MFFLRDLHAGGVCSSVGGVCWSEVGIYHSPAAFPKFGNMEDSAFPSETSGSLPALIWRISLGLED